MAKEIFCVIGVDVDAVAGWLGSYGGEDSPDDISRGIFAGEVGTRRLLKMFDKYDMKTTWFIPGHSIETFPEETRMVVDAGHEVGMHGYSHENPIAMTPEQEEAVLVKCIDLIEQVSGRRPTGYVAPWWEFSNVTNELLLKHGIKYDHSLMHRDFVPYYVRVGDSWTKIDYSKKPEEWMKPLVRGEETDLIEIPASWYLDDLPPMMFIKGAPNSHGFVNPRHLEEIWRDQFDYVYREEDYAVFGMTIHPDVSGRPQVILMLERLIEYISGHDGIRWATMDEIADDFKAPVPAAGLSLPGQPDELAPGRDGHVRARPGGRCRSPRRASAGGACRSRSDGRRRRRPRAPGSSRTGTPRPAASRRRRPRRPAPAATTCGRRRARPCRCTAPACPSGRRPCRRSTPRGRRTSGRPRTGPRTGPAASGRGAGAISRCFPPSTG